MYKKISYINSNEDVLDVKDEFIDRFGEIPKETENLISAAFIKSLAKKAGFMSVTENNYMIMFKFTKKGKIDIERITNVMNDFQGKLVFKAGVEPYLAYNKENNKVNTLKIAERVLVGLGG